MTRDDIIAAYIDLWVGLPSADLSVVTQLTHQDVVFRDPFNVIMGHAEFMRLLEHSRRTVSNLSFDVFGQGASATSEHYYLHWRMTGSIKMFRLDITGMSSLLFDDSGKIISHTDHWDAAEQFYELLPLIGPTLRLVKRRAALPKI